MAAGILRETGRATTQTPGPDTEAGLPWKGAADTTITTVEATTTIAESQETTVTAPSGTTVIGNITTATTEVRPREVAEDTAAAAIGTGTTGATTISGGATGDLLADAAAEDFITMGDAVGADAAVDTGTTGAAWTSTRRTSSPTT